jgi:hydrogenase-4 component B
MTVISSGFFLLALIIWAAGAVGSLAFRKYDRAANWWGNSFAALGAVAGLISSLTVLLCDATFSLAGESTLPLLSVSFQVDKLSAFFVLIISLVALFASIYGLGYVTHYYKKYDIGALGFYYNAFLAGMAMVVSAHNALFFLVVWELMSLASYFLVIYEKKEV